MFWKAPVYSSMQTGLFGWAGLLRKLFMSEALALEALILP